MKKQFILLLSALALVCASCSTVRKSTVAVVPVQTSVVQYPTVTDLVVLDKVEKTTYWSFSPFKKEDVQLMKENLMFDVLKETGADVLLEAQYNYIKVPFGERRLTVTGYPARFKDFRKATDADLEALKAAYGKPCGHESKCYNVAQPNN